MKSLILFNMSYQSDWGKGIVNRNYHVFQALKRSGEYEAILSIDFIPFSFRKKARMLLREGMLKKNNLTVHQSLSCRVDRDPQQSHHYTMTALHTRSLTEVLKKIAFPVEELTIWSYNPFIAAECVQLHTAYPGSLFIFDAVDNWIEHPSYADYRDQLENAYLRIKKDADIIFTVSEGLVDFFGKRQNVFYVPNGVDTVHFQEGACTPSIQQLLFQKPRAGKYVVGYHGIIQSRLNFLVFDYLATKHPDIDFVLIGPAWKESRHDVASLQKLPNVHIVGALPYAYLPSAIQCMDVAIVPHKVDALTHSMNPLKLYEYLAAGKPIISTPVAGADQFQDLVQTAISPEDFSTHIVRLLDQEEPALRERRIAMARTHDWKQRIDIMLDIIHTSQHEHAHNT